MEERRWVAGRSTPAIRLSAHRVRRARAGRRQLQLIPTAAASAPLRRGGLQRTTGAGQERSRQPSWKLQSRRSREPNEHAAAAVSTARAHRTRPGARQTHVDFEVDFEVASRGEVLSSLRHPRACVPWWPARVLLSWWRSAGLTTAADQYRPG